MTVRIPVTRIASAIPFPATPRFKSAETADVFRPFQTAAEAERFAQTQGVTADYAGDVEMANNVSETLHILRQKGIPLPPGLSIINDTQKQAIRRVATEKVEPPGLYVSQYATRSGLKPNTIYLNPSLPFGPWRTIDQYTEWHRQQRMSPTSHRCYVVMHEIGHALHEHTLGQHLNDTFRDIPLRDPLNKLSRLGSNALLSPPEFVADMFAKKMLSKSRLSSTPSTERYFWDLYREYRGPQIPGI